MRESQKGVMVAESRKSLLKLSDAKEKEEGTVTGIFLFLFDNGKKIFHKILIYKYKFYIITIIEYNVMFDTYTTYIHTKHNKLK